MIEVKRLELPIKDICEDVWCDEEVVWLDSQGRVWCERHVEKAQREYLEYVMVLASL